jgi:pentatricopeptide repeat-containing protein PET309
MLERTTGCLESGSLRRLLPGSKKALKSRRELHSAFWNHGAIELELSPLWAALIRGPDPLDQSCEREEKNSSGQGGMLLDFLYPAGTIRFLRQYSGWGPDRLDGRRSIAGLAKLGHRLYTSSAKDPSASHDVVEASEDIDDGYDDDTSAKYLQEYLRLERRSDYEEAWRRYSELDKKQQQRLRFALIEYFAASNRVVDAERTTELFEQLAEKRKLQPAYIAVIRAHLRLHNLPNAIALNKAAVAKLGFPVGADQLLAYMVEKSYWPHAIQTWQQFREFQDPTRNVQSDILELVYQLPTRLERTFELADYITKEMKSSSDRPEGVLSDLVEFGSRIVKYLLLHGPISNPSDQASQKKLLDILAKWGLDTPDVHHHCIERLLRYSNDARPAVRLYREARRSKEVQFSRWVLHGLLKAFCDHHSVLGMQQVLDDFFRCHGKPSRRTYQLCMREFAAQGDAETVRALFDQYTGRFKLDWQFAIQKVHSADEFAPLLHVHAKRGELPAVLATFDEIQERYKLKPTLLCWNIVLNAYGKIHDIDGAFACFDQLLESTTLQPDDYTFGTMMSICATKGDRERAVELYKLAESMKIEKSTTMIDSLVLTFLRDEYFNEAEKICEDSLKLELKGSRTRMWNSLLVGYANRRDLQNVNRLLRRMSEAKVEYDQFTYSALMQALAVAKQPDRARTIMTEVMREAGIKPTNIHYAVLMGGYIANREYHKVFRVQNAMRRRGIKESAGSKLLAIKAAAAEDQKLFGTGTEAQQSQRALQIFQDTLSSMDAMELSQPVSKGTRRMAQDMAYPSMLYSFVMFILGQRDELETVSAMYDQYIKTLPEHRRGSPDNQVLSALMISKLRAYDFAGVQECWDIALSQARKVGRAIPSPGPQAAAVKMPTTSEILPDHQLDLTELITTQIISLSIQRKVDDIPPLINALVEEGFLLSNDNWNQYIQVLARRYRYKFAFELCERMLMPNWTGWARIRWQAPERNRLPLELRALRKQPKHYRPKAHTLLYLARGYLELQSMAAESTASQIMLAELERSCPKTIHAIRTMQRVDDSLERDVLRDFVV